jgi:hypothetical protein
VTLKPAIEKWRRQFGATRPLEVRAAPPRKLHDRHIMLDRLDVWTVGQSFNALAEHSHSGITKTIDPLVSADKIAAYEDIWDTATPV